MFKSVNPYTQSLIAEFPLLNTNEVKNKLATASNIFKQWRQTSFDERASLMVNLAALLRQQKEEHARTITVEMGKVISESLGEIEKCSKACEYYALHAEALLADHFISSEAKSSYIHYQPIGAVFAIMPWNFPYWQVIRFAVPAIMAGNVVLLKHAPNVCVTSLAIEKIFLAAGFPEGVFQSLIIDVDKVEQVIQHDIVQAVILTGSEYAGAQVASIAGKNIKKSVLELGGSDPFIIFSDANLEAAAIIASQSRMRNAGQSCIAAKRFIIIENVKEEFLHHFIKNVSALNQGDPLNDQTTMAPMARLNLAEKLEKQMHDSINKGAKVLFGGNRQDCNYQPTVLDNVKPGMPAFDEETFGPLAAIITAKDETEAIALANQSRYGLGSSLWTGDIKKAEILAKQIEAGSVFINSYMRSDVRFPFGGIKKSGYGRELSEVGIKEFTNMKTIFIE